MQYTQRVKFDHALQCLQKMQDLDRTLEFVSVVRTELANIMRNDSESWFAFVYHILVNVCKIPKKQLAENMKLSASMKKLVEVTSYMFQRKVAKIDSQEDADKLYKLLDGYPVIFSPGIRHCIMESRYLVAKVEFVPLIRDLIHAETSPESWKESLTDCIRIWLSSHGLEQTLNILKNFHLDMAAFEEYCTENDVSRYIPGDLDRKLEMIIDPALPREVRRIVSVTITQSWKQLNEAERNLILNATVQLLQDGATESADTILRNVVGKENPFDSQSAVGIIKYLASETGRGFVALLTALKRTPNYNQLSIKDRLLSFHTFWEKIIGDIAEQQAPIAVVQILTKNEYENFKHIDSSFYESGGNVSADQREQCDKLFQQFKVALSSKERIDTLFQKFAPSQLYWDEDLKELHKIYTKLSNWHNLSLNAIINQRWSLVTQNDKILHMMRMIGDSKICISIWKALVGDIESVWKLKSLRNMGTYEVVDWLRSLNREFSYISRDFNMETVIQIIYDKELNGRQLDKNEVKEETMQNWFDEWNAQNYGPDKVSQQMIEGVIDVFFREVEQRKSLEKQRKGKGPMQKKFNMTKLNEVMADLRNLWGSVKQEIITNSLTVRTIQRYFMMLSGEDTRGIRKEMGTVLQGLDPARASFIDIQGISENVVMVFQCLRALESAKSVRDATQLFMQLLGSAPQGKAQHLQEDRGWKQRLILLTDDYANYTMPQLQSFWNTNQSVLPHLSDVSIKWLVTIASNRKCITQLYTKFHDDVEFDKHMQIFGTSDPIQQTRAMALTNVRNSVVRFLNVQFYSATMMSNKLKELSETISPDDLSSLEVVVSSWTRLLVDSFDASQYKFQQDKDTLAQLTAFTFSNESQHKKGSTKYLRARLGEAKQDDEEKRPEKQMNLMTQNAFDAFTDRLLMFMTGDQGNVNVGDTPIQPIPQMQENDVIDLFRARRKALSQCGVKKFVELEQILWANHINGAKLIAAFEAVKTDANAMSNLLFGVDQQIYDPEKQDKIANEIVKVIDFQLLRNKVQDDIIPKFDLCKKIAEYRLLYYSEGGREMLDRNRNISIEETDKKGFEKIEKNWEKYVKDWEQKIEQLRKDFNVLTFYTVNDMRWIMGKIRQYINQGAGQDKEKYLRELYSSLSFIDSSLKMEECKVIINSLWRNQQPQTMDQLGRDLQKTFGQRTTTTVVLQESFPYQFLALSRPHLFHCQQNAILTTVMRLFLSRSQSQRPAASRVLFCSESTTLEEVECLLMRCNLRPQAPPKGQRPQANNSKTKPRAHTRASPMDSLLHILVQPERLHPEIQDKFLKILSKYVNPRGSQALFAIVTADSRSKIYFQLNAFANYTHRAFTENDRRRFFKEILCSAPDEFHAKRNKAPLCAVYLSQSECVGKSYVIRKISSNNQHGLIHVPINTRSMDLDFIVDRLMSVPKNQSKKTVFHINVSSDAGSEVNEVMFQLLVLRYLKKSSGGSFTANANHAFLVELPTQTTSTLRQTNIDDVREYFYFLAGSKSHGISKFEVQDALSPRTPLFDQQLVISNVLTLTAKEMFVLKYLDAFEKKQLMITGKTEDDWNHAQHEDIPAEKQKELIAKYCPQGAGSLVFLKSFLRYMYRQLIQLYTAHTLVDNLISMDVDRKGTRIQYHMVIAESMIESAPQIACHMYEIPKMNENVAAAQNDENKENQGDEEDGDENKDDEKEQMLDETRGDEEFFLVKHWAQAKSPMVLMNQRPIIEANSLNMALTTLEEDTAQNNEESTFSLLAMNLDSSDSFGAMEWKKFREVMSKMGNLAWDLYNFEEDRKERLQQLRQQGFANETIQKQKQKLGLLLRICGGFISKDAATQEVQLNALYEQNKDYALTFDNILKIVAIFFRVNSGIPVLIMGETGCGKTKLLSFMATALGIKMFSIDVHGGYSIADLQRDLVNPIEFARANETKTVLVFLDEVNTSPDVGGFKEVICDHSLKGEEFPENMVIIAALNPYRQRHKTVVQIEEEKEANANNPKHFVDDLDRQMGSLVYRVFPLPPSLKTYVWNFGALSQMDEQQYIAVMTRTTWDDTEFLRQCPNSHGFNINKFKKLRNCFIDMICHCQQFLRTELNDKSVCSLRDVRRANKLFIWFFGRETRKQKGPATRIIEAMFLSIAQCYYYRLNNKQRKKFRSRIESLSSRKLGRNFDFERIIESEQNQYVMKLKIESGIAINRAFRENLFVMLVGLSTQTPTVIVGKPGSSKTLAMVTLQENLSSSTKNKALTKMGFDDYFVVSFQCSKLTTAASIEERWNFAKKYEKRLNERRDKKKTLARKVIMFLDEVGLAEQSPHRPLKVLHKLLENPDIAFIGLSNWALDSAKMNRVVLHNVLPPSRKDLRETAEMIMQGDGNNNMLVHSQLAPRIPKIAQVYESIQRDKLNNPFGFDFFGHRDFYNLVSYLKYRLSQPKVSLEDDMVLVEAVLRNFGGETKAQAERFLLPKIAEKILVSGNVNTQQIWQRFNPLTLIRDNVRQTKELSRPRSSELRNIMLIADSPVVWKILFDAEVLNIAETEIIFGSKFKNDVGSTIYLYRTIERVRGAMQSGKVCVLLKLDQLYDSLYDVLNQRYVNVDGQKFCKICMGGEFMQCQIHHTFRCIVVQSRNEAHHLSSNPDDFTPVAFLNRFEKQYLDPGLLESFGVGQGWNRKWQLLKSTINRQYEDHLLFKDKDLFIGFNKTQTFISLLTTEMKQERNEDDEDDEWVDLERDDEKQSAQDAVDECYRMLLKTTSIQYLIQDTRRLRKRDFVAYASLIDLVQREGVQNDSKDHALLRVVTHDTYQIPSDFNHKLKDKDYDGVRVRVHFDVEAKQDEEDEQKIQVQSAENVHIIKFKEIASFLSESEFSHYVYDFLNNRDTQENTLVIMCDPAMNNEQLVHYLHAQYLIEKARAAARGSSRQKEEKQSMRNIVFLIYMSRQTPYPLIFNREWKHLFLDALLPADHQMFPQIQVNDINVFDHNDKRNFAARVTEHTDRIVFNSYERAMNNVVLGKDFDGGTSLESNIPAEIERIKTLLNTEGTVNDGGRFRQVLVERIQNVLVDTKSGAIDCLKKTLKDRKRNDRGSIRAHVMEKLAELVKDQLVEILTIVFSNGNSVIYQTGNTQAEKIWLKLVSEPRILRIFGGGSGGKAKNTRHSIDRALSRSKFPFSSHIHSYLSSFKEDCLNAWKQKMPVIESGPNGQKFFSKQMQMKLESASLTVRIDNLPEASVRNLSQDIIQLEATRLGLRRHGATILPHLVTFIHQFLWKSSIGTHDDVLLDKPRKVRKEQSNKVETGDVQIGGGVVDQDEESSDDDDFLDVQIQGDEEDEDSDGDEDDAKDDEKRDEPPATAAADDNKEEKKDEEDGQDDEEEEEEVEERNVQIHEIYATLWANEKIILQTVEVLSTLKDTPQRLVDINREWEQRGQNLAQCLGNIMNRLLEEVQSNLRSSTREAMQQRVQYLLSVSQSFTDVIHYLETLGFDKNIVDELRKKWNIIRLATICVSACPKKINNEFVDTLWRRFGDHKFDDLNKVGSLIQSMDQLMANDPNKDETLQWFCQNYMRYFAFSGMKVDNQFTQSLIEVIAEEKDQRDEQLYLKPNTFTKFEIASQFHLACERNHHIRNIVSNTVENGELKSVVACLLSRAAEQHLHHNLRSRFTGDELMAPSKTEIKEVTEQLESALESTNKLDQVLAISECKVILHYFIRYLQSILEAKGSIDEEGIKHRGKTYRKASYLREIGKMLIIPNECTPSVRAIKQGLQYFFVSEIWSRGGAQNAIRLISKPVFPRVLAVQLFKDEAGDEQKVPENIPRDDTFLVALAADDQKEAQIKEAFDNAVNGDVRPNIAFQRRFYVHLIGAIFNNGYLKGGSQRFNNIAPYINEVVAADLNGNAEAAQRLGTLLTNLLTNNSPDSSFKLKSKRTLEDVQMIRLCLHFLAAILSVPQSPFSRLFHCPHEMKKEYLPGMPEDASMAMLKVFAKCGVWLCPNDHVYFVANCTRTRGSGKCATCGANIGNDASKGSHNAATGNRKIGVVSADGKIIPDSKGATQGTAVYNAEKLAPKGYVMTESADEVIREMNEISVVIIRWMNHAALFVHGTETQLSKAAQLMQIRPDEVTKSARTQLMKGMRKLQSKLDLSFESVMYLMHQIIHNVQSKFTEQWGADGIPKVEDPKLRKDLERWLVNECIRPVIQDTTTMIGSVREKVSSSVTVLKWAKRFEGRVDLKSDQGKAFARDYLPNIFLPFRLLTLSTFKEKFLERNENKSKYPVTWGILNTIDTAAGYSVFALKHLPAMITWMKLLKQRLNQRLNLDEVLEHPGQYSCKWVMDRCANEGWGDIRVWRDAFEGFKDGWNHLAQRVTTNEEMEDVPIDTVNVPIHEPDPNNDDEKEEKKQDGVENQEEPQNGHGNDQEEIDLKLQRKNQFKKFVKIAHTCEALPIKPFVPKSSKRSNVTPVDVPLVFGMDTGLNGKLDSSIMIRKIIQHYVNANNKVLEECHQLNEDDDGSALGLNPGLDSSFISRPQDVVDIDEEEFRGMVQECTQQKLRYGDDVPYSLNLRLLETMLRERYITGRKFIYEKPIEFEFAGQFNIPQILQKIDRKHALNEGGNPELIKYFVKAEVQILNIVNLNIQQRAALNFNNIGDNDVNQANAQMDDVEQRQRRNQRQKQRTLDAYSNAKNAVEQTLIALERQKNLPKKAFSLGTYMKDNLHLYPQEYDPFIRIQQLQLRHLESVWRYLEKMQLIEQGTWHEIPQTTMELYKNPINEDLKTALMQFITMHDMDALWQFLMAFRRFLRDTCRTPLSETPNQIDLVEYLGYAEDIDEELVGVFPTAIKLHQAGWAYYHAARNYQERNDREAQQ